MNIDDVIQSLYEATAALEVVKTARDNIDDLADDMGRKIMEDMHMCQLDYIDGKLVIDVFGPSNKEGDDLYSKYLDFEDALYDVEYRIPEEARSEVAAFFESLAKKFK